METVRGEVRRVGTEDHALWSGRVAAWAVVAAVVLGALGVWKVGVWANHWYIAERFYADVDPAHPKDGPYWDIATVLRSGNEALVDGAVRLGEAVVLVVVAVVLRRRQRVPSPDRAAASAADGPDASHLVADRERPVD
ncbi:hypothetical protein Cch01nite_04570 [Cellulomonas chitinilytica]|uniref:Uncharacterized protein n=1 Tax=Cellulomonas chitinilytica TaxID=398759 RepID=A0A919TYI2_9CELL|nr:hypothetical protein [Cellulomonas chitinilytica]GIG19733.1 hypothetical protein Cch01nite_04570 [Cellulomonas chitinilytica]